MLRFQSFGMAEAESLIDKEYLKEHYLEVYLEDAIAQLLMSRQEAKKPETSTPPIKIPNIKPCRFFKEYFAGLRHGNHVLFREFAFASATPYNRLSVITSLLEAYRNHLFKENRHNAKDYHSMMQLVWPDFPMKVVLNAFEAYDGEDKNDENGINFLDFVKALKASFCTGECDYESNVLNNILDNKLNELSELFAQGGDVPKSLLEAEYLVNVHDPKKSQQLSLTHKVLDGSEFKRLLNFNDANSVSSDEPDIISGSSESKMSVTKSKKKGKAKKSSTQSKTAQCKGSNTSLCSTVSSKSTPPVSKSTDVGKSGSQRKSAVTNRSASQTKSAAQNKSSTSLHRNNSAKSASETKNETLLKNDLGGKQLSASLNVITVSVKLEGDEKPHRRRSRSKSVTPDQRSQSKKPWRSNSGSSESSLSP